MNITAGSDLKLNLHLTTIGGKKFRVSDCEKFQINVFTNKNKTNLFFGIDDIDQSGEKHDKIYIPSDMLELLNSGVIQYTAEFVLIDTEVIQKKTFISEVYFANPNKDNLGKFSSWIERKLKELKENVGENGLKIEEIETKLLEEIKRSLEQDIEIKETISKLDPGQVEENITQLLADFLTKDEAEEIYQKKGNYAPKSDFEELKTTVNELESTVWDCASKESFDELSNQLSSKLNKSTYEEEKKNFLTEHQSLEEYYTKSEVDKAYQPKGDYALKSDIPTDYVTQSVLEQYAKIWCGSQEDYNGLVTKDNKTLYIII